MIKRIVQNSSAHSSAPELDVDMASHVLKELTREEVSKVCYSNIHDNVQARISQQHNREGDLVRKL